MTGEAAAESSPVSESCLSNPWLENLTAAQDVPEFSSPLASDPARLVFPEFL
jgi:hypothetical protein